MPFFDFENREHGSYGNNEQCRISGVPPRGGRGNGTQAKSGKCRVTFFIFSAIPLQ
jgi:hypothetical protein